MQRGEPESSQEEPEKSPSNEEDSQEKVDLSESVTHLLVVKLFLESTQQICLVFSNYKISSFNFSEIKYSMIISFFSKSLEYHSHSLVI